MSCAADMSPLTVMAACDAPGDTPDDMFDACSSGGEVSERRMFEDLLGGIFLHVGWYRVTKQLTTPEKELFADSVDAWSERLHPGDGARVDRWWRD